MARVEIDGKRFSIGLEVALERLNLQSRQELLKLGYRVRNAAVMRTPVDTGRMRASWYVKPVEDPRGPAIEVGNSVNEYAWYIEWGTKPHEIRAKNAQFMRFVDRNGQVVYRKRVWHPGTRAYAPLRGGLVEGITGWRPRMV